MSDVFISYSRLDKEFVGELREALLAQNQTVWIDWEAIPPSQSWWEEIQKVIASAHNFVVILSSHSMASPICHMEIEYAQQMRKRIIPVLHSEYLRNESVAAIEHRLARIGEDVTREIWADRDSGELFDANDGYLKHINYFFFQSHNSFDERFSELMKVIETDYDHKEKHTILTLRAQQWDEHKRDRSFLLIANELTEYETWLDNSTDKEPSPTPLHLAYLDASNLRNQQLRNIRRASIVGVSVAVVAFSFAFIASIFGLNAAKDASESSTLAANAHAQLATATQVLITATHSAQDALQAHVTLDGLHTQTFHAQATLTQVSIDADIAETFINSIIQFSQEPLEQIRVLTNLLEQYPNQPQIYVSRGLLYQQEADYSQAIDDFTTAIQLDAERAVAYINRGTAYNDLEEYDQALSDYAEALGLGAEPATVYLNMGTSHYLAGNMNEAVQYLTMAIELDPKLALAYYNRGQAYRVRNEPENALVDYSQTIQLRPQYIPAYKNRALVYKILGDFDGALQDFETLHEIDATDIEAYLDHIDLLMMRYKPYLALDVVQQAIQSGLSDPQLYIQRSNIYVEIDQIDAALTDLTWLIDADLHNDSIYADASSKRGIIYLRLREYNLAVADFTSAIELMNASFTMDYQGTTTTFINPELMLAYHNRGLAYMGMENYYAAIDDFDQCNQLDSRESDCYYWKAYAYFDIGSFDLALAEVNRAIELSDKSAYYLLRGYIYYSQEEYQLSIENFDSVLEISPRNGWAYNNRAYANYFLDNTQQAIEDVSTAIEFWPRELNFYDSRCELYLLSGQKELIAIMLSSGGGNFHQHCNSYTMMPCKILNHQMRTNPNGKQVAC